MPLLGIRSINPLIHWRKLFIFTLLLGLVACKNEREVEVLKLAHNLDQTTSVHQAMVLMAKRLDELSDGTMRIDIYPSGQIFPTELYQPALVFLLQHNHARKFYRG